MKLLRNLRDWDWNRQFMRYEHTMSFIRTVCAVAAVVLLVVRL